MLWRSWWHLLTIYQPDIIDNSYPIKIVVHHCKLGKKLTLKYLEFRLEENLQGCRFSVHFFAPETELCII